MLNNLSLKDVAPGLHMLLDLVETRARKALNEEVINDVHLSTSTVNFMEKIGTPKYLLEAILRSGVISSYDEEPIDKKLCSLPDQGPETQD